MNKMKKFASIAAAVLMTACMAAPMTSIYSFADDPNGTTTFSMTYTPTDSETISDVKAVKIFTATYENETFSVTGWGTGVTLTNIISNVYSGDNTSKIKTELETISSGTGTDTEKAQAVAAKLEEWKTTSESTETTVTDDAKKEASAKIQEFASAVAKLNLDGVVGTYANQLVTFSDAGLDVGYYVVTCNAKKGTSPNEEVSKSLGMLTVVNGTVKQIGTGNANDKVGLPQVMKKVYEESYTTNDSVSFAGSDSYEVGTGYNDIADYDINDNVPFRLYGTMPTNLDAYTGYYYKFTDTLDSQFDVPTTLTIKIGAELTGGPIATLTATFSGGTWTVMNGSTSDKNCSVKVTEVKDATDNTKVVGNKIEIAFENIKAYSKTTTEGETTTTTSVTKDTVVTVDYNAKLNSTATVGTPGQDNAVNLTYSNSPNVYWNPDTTDDTPDTPYDTETTPDDEVRVYTYAVKIDKKFFNAAGGELTPAEVGQGTYNQVLFNLKSGTGSNATLLKFVAVAEDGTTNAGYDYILAADQTATTGVVEDLSLKLVDGELVIRIKGLDEGTYTLVEKQAPSGFNKADDQTVTITANTGNTQTWTPASGDTLTEFSYTVGSTTYSQGATKFTVDSTEYTDVTYDTTTGKVTGFKNGETAYTVDYTGDTVKIKQGETELESADAIISEIAKLSGTIDAEAKAKIENRKGSSLPSTGGIGTTLFYVGGGALVAVAGVFLITKKRMSQKED